MCGRLVVGERSDERAGFPSVHAPVCAHAGPECMLVATEFADAAHARALLDLRRFH